MNDGSGEEMTIACIKYLAGMTDLSDSKEIGRNWREYLEIVKIFVPYEG